MIAARQIFLGRGGAKLPYDAEVEYLQSTGTQYIDTGVLVTSTTRIRALASCATISNGFFFGSYANSTYIGAQYYSGIGLRVFCGRAATSYNQSGFVAGTAYLYEIDNSNGEISIDGAIVKTTGTSGGVGGIIYAFCNNALTEYQSCKIYSIQIWDNGTLVRDLIPVRFTNELGQTEGAMYDRVSKQLFRNQGSGRFVVGPDVGWMNRYVTDGAIVMWYDKYDNDVSMADKLAPYISQVLSAREARAFSVSVAGDVAFPSVDPFNTSGGTGNFGRVANVNTGTLLIYCGNSQGTQLSIGAAPKSVSLVVDGGVWTCYANDSGGSLVSVSRTAVPETTTGWSMSNIQTSNQTYKTIRIYNRALTAEEIAANYAVDKQRFNLP